MRNRPASLTAAAPPSSYQDPQNIASVAKATAVPAATSAATSSTPASNGFALAWAVMGLLVLAVLFALILGLRSLTGHAVPRAPAWLAYALPILCLAGLGIAVYLAFIETTSRPAVCGPVGDCNAVQSSPYSKLFGVLPIGLLGTIGYVAILVAWAWQKLRADAMSAYAPLAIFAMALFGVLFSIYLTSLELFVIHAVCIWCLGSAVTMALVLALSVEPALRTMAPAAE